MGFLAHLPKLLSLLPIVIDSVKMVEGAFKRNPGEGKEEASKRKQDMAVEFVADALVATEVLTNKNIVNDAKFMKLVRKFIDVAVELLNFIKDHD